MAVASRSYLREAFRGKATAKGIHPKGHYETRQRKLANFFKNLPVAEAAPFDGLYLGTCKCTNASISAVCGNISNGVIERTENRFCNSARSRASVGGLQET